MHPWHGSGRQYCSARHTPGGTTEGQTARRPPAQVCTHPHPAAAPYPRTHARTCARTQTVQPLHATLRPRRPIARTHRFSISDCFRCLSSSSRCISAAIARAFSPSSASSSAWILRAQVLRLAPRGYSEYPARKQTQRTRGAQPSPVKREDLLDLRLLVRAGLLELYLRHARADLVHALLCGAFVGAVKVRAWQRRGLEAMERG